MQSVSMRAMAVAMGALGMLPGVAAAQEDIVVTASRIARTAPESDVPIRVVDRQAIDRAGQDNLADLLRREPALANGFGQGNSNMRGQGNGLNILDLHGLGTVRTLVLVNGRRMVGGQSGTSAVDLNMIPSDLVKRVEIVTGGASAAYGSDAMAGVVNIILDDRPEGVTFSAQSGISDEGDSPRQRIAATAGAGFADGRGHAWLHGTYAHDGGLLSSQRAFAATDYAGLSPFTPQGAFNLNGTIFDIGFDPAKGVAFRDYDGATLQKGIGLNEGYNRNAYRRISVPVDRVLLGGGLTFDVAPRATIYLEGQFGDTRSRAASEPYAAAGGDPAVDGAGQIEVPGGLRIDNPYIPAPIAAEIAARNGDASPANDVRFIAFRRRLGDVFNRSNANHRRMWRGVAGVRGAAGGWNWDIGYVFGRSTDRTASDSILRDRLVSALDAVRVGNAIVCRDPAARAAGCQPLNIFGANTASPQAIAWLRAGGGQQAVLDSTLEQHVLTATVSGAPLHLRGREVRLVAGAEYRHEFGFDDWDANTNAGGLLGPRADDTRGSFDVKSAFAEISVPLTDTARLDGQVRLDHYSTAGTVLNWKIGGGWAPVAGINLRAAYSVASRAPSILELYTSQRETSPGSLTLDPCNGVTATRGNPYDALCRSIPGIAAAVANGGALAYSSVEAQSINGFNGGNPSLKEEEARSLTAGITLSPRAVPRLTLSIDYYRIHIANAILTPTRPETVVSCLVDAASAACGGLVRRLPNGKLTRVDAVLINGGGIRHSGIDVGVDYSLPLGNAGSLGLTGRWTHLLTHERQVKAGGAFIDELGQLQDADHARLGSGFRDRFVADAVYRTGPLSLSWTARYYGPMQDTKTVMSGPPAAINHVPAMLYNDVQLRFALPGARKREFWLGVTNLFDRQPPLLPNGVAASGLLGVETSQDYDAIGRTVYAGITARF